MPQDSDNPKRGELRCFIALDIPPDARNALRIPQRTFKALPGARIRFTRVENLHLTLKFLGEISPETAEDVRDRLQTVAFAPFSVQLGDLGVFPPRGKPRVVWVGLAGDGVTALHASVETALQGTFPSENRFRSHITLGRVRNLHKHHTFQKLLEESAPAPVQWTVDRFVLKSSKLTPEGPIYRDLQVYGANL